MSTTTDRAWISWLITLAAGAVAAAGIWLLAGQPEAAAFGFVIAAAAREASSPGGCVRRVLRHAG